MHSYIRRLLEYSLHQPSKTAEYSMHRSSGITEVFQEPMKLYNMKSPYNKNPIKERKILVNMQDFIWLNKQNTVASMCPGLQH